MSSASSLLPALPKALKPVMKYLNNQKNGFEQSSGFLKGVKL